MTVTVEQLIRECVHDAIIETAFYRPDTLEVLRKAAPDVEMLAIRRFNHPLVHNKMRDLLNRRRKR
jgi:hypothetical protein